MKELPPYRKNLYELELERRLSNLEIQFDQLTSHIRVALPTAGIGQTISHHAPVENEHTLVSMGHGPRFAAKYNLATTDAERRALLEALPHSDFTNIWLDHYLESLKWSDYPSGDSRNIGIIQDGIWKVWAQNQWANQDLPTWDGSLPDLLERRPDAFYWEVFRDDRRLLVVLPCSRVQGAYILEIVRGHVDGRGVIYQLRYLKTFRYMGVEERWLEIKGGIADSLHCTLNEWLESLGMKPYLPVSDEVLAEAFENLVEQFSPAFRELLEMKRDTNSNEKHLETLCLRGPDGLMIRIDRPYSQFEYYEENKLSLEIYGKEISDRPATTIKLATYRQSQIVPWVRLDKNGRLVEGAVVPHRLRHDFVQKARTLLTLQSDQFEVVKIFDTD